MAEFAKHFGKSPELRGPEHHRKSPGAAELRNIFRLETERTISNDWVVRYENRLLQVERQNRNWAPARAKVTVCEWQDGSIDIHYGERKLSWTEIEAGGVKPAIKPPIKMLRPLQGADARELRYVTAQQGRRPISKSNDSICHSE